MAAFSISPLSLLLLAALSVCALPLRSAPPQKTDEPQEIEYEADSSEIDYRNNVAVLHGVSIKQGELKIQAKEAQVKGGINFNNNEWTFSDDVHIATASGSLASSKANVTFVNNRVARVRISGSPATFEQKLENNQGTVRGRAGTIDYDFGGSTVKLTDDVWFSNGKDEFTSNLVIYNIREERVQINPGGQAGRVKGIIRPPVQPKAGAAAGSENAS